MDYRPNRSNQDLSIEYYTVSIKEIITENKDLVQLHWNEVSQDQGDLPLRISDENYTSLEEEGFLRVSAVYDGDTMVGYCVFVVSDSLHSGEPYANNDCIYVHPDYRGKGIADYLLKFSEDSLAVEGVKYIGISMKQYAPFTGLVSRAGYTLTEYHYSKSIG